MRVAVLRRDEEAADRIDAGAAAGLRSEYALNVSPVRAQPSNRPVSSASMSGASGLMK